MPKGWYLEPGENDPTMKIVAGVVAVGLIALGVVFATRGDDKSGGGASKPPATTVVSRTTTTAAVSATTTTSTTSTTSTSAPSSTTTTGPAAAVDGTALAAAMPTAADVPSGWTMHGEPQPDPQPGIGSGYCNGTDQLTLAQAGGVAQAFGPEFDLPTGSWFSFDLFAFDSDDAATAFVQTERDQANLCSTSPFSYTRSENDLGYLDEHFSNDTQWNVLEASAASAGQFVGGEGIMRVTIERRYSTQANGKSLSVKETVLQLYEQHGRVVIVYWSGGSWDFQGMGTGQPANAHQPLVAELDAAADVAGKVMVARLTTAGAV